MRPQILEARAPVDFARAFSATRPVEQATKFELVVNLKAAHTLGVTIAQQCSHGPIASSNDRPDGAVARDRAAAVTLRLGPRAAGRLTGFPC
jgi:ABC-type uncharacterized transport system substrate-binding protein